MDKEIIEEPTNQINVPTDLKDKHKKDYPDNYLEGFALRGG